MPRIDRYVFQELLPPFLWGIGAFAAIGVSAAVLFDLLRQVSEARLPLAIALLLLALQLPYFISLAIPMAVLLTCLLTFARMHTDGELMALQAAGLHLRRLVQSSLCFAFMALILMFGLSEGLVPVSQAQAQQVLMKTLQQGNFELQDPPILYKDYGRHSDLDRLFYAQQSEDQTLYGLTVLDWTSPEEPKIITAKSATWHAAENRWTFKNGIIYPVNIKGTTPYILEFSEQQIQLASFAVPEINPNTLSLIQAQQYLAILRQQDMQSKARTLEIQIHRKVALPFTVLVFGFVGSVLGMSRRRLAASSGFGLSLVLVLGQYVLIFIADVGGQLGQLSPWFAAWLPNLIMVAIGLGSLVGRTEGLRRE
ncbi:MAG: YjgP/YjgQ family permease [Acaryochloris sp. RU_4_1]|nr:YjgP/YjgQ family permease [Acaryochloris sp. RU_4_1]NJR54057.1 YjgP/YjgQ family permease [Acaryochloris sp. CRU_2_0]